MPPIRKACKLSTVTYAEVQLEWEIPHFFSETDTEQVISYESSIYKFHNFQCDFKLYQHSSADYMNLYVNCIRSKQKIKLEFYFGLKKVNGSICQLFRSIKTLDLPRTNVILAGSFSKLRLMKQRSELTTSDTLTIACTIKCGKSFHESPALHGPMKLKKLDTLSENYKGILSNKDNSDVILQVKDQNFNAHRIILMARSPVFAAMFRHDTLEKQSGIVTISDCDPHSFHEFLEFLYSGELKNISFRSALHLYRTADKYAVQELKSFCVEYMERYLNQNNLCDVLILADMYEETSLFSAAETYFQLNTIKVIDTTTWQSLLKNHYPLANRVLKGLAAKVKTEH